MKRKIIAGLLILVTVFLIAGCGGGPAQQGKKTAEKVIYVVQTSPPNMLNQLKAGEIDGFVAWEPFNAAAVEQGIGKYLLTSRQIWPDHPCCVLAATPATGVGVEKALVWAQVQATRFINNPANKEKVIRYAVEFGGKERITTIKALQNIKFVEFPNVSQFRNYYTGLKEKYLLVKTAADLGYSNDQAFFNDFLSPSIYQEITSSKPVPVPATVKVRLGYLRQDLHELAVYVAQKEGFYQQVGLIPGKNLELKEFANGVAVMEGFKNKDIDASNLGGAPAMLKRVNDNIKITILAGANDEGSAIVVKKEGIISLADLQGKTIAIPGIGTVQWFLLDKAAGEAGLKLKIK